MTSPKSAGKKGARLRGKAERALSTTSSTLKSEEPALQEGAETTLKRGTPRWEKWMSFYI